MKLYAALEDGIPLWLRTEIELTVSGKSREEELGTILPEGWKLAAVESPIPVAVDDAGRMKAQVRAGKWTVRADAFRFDNPKEFRYAAGAKPAVAEELVAFRARPDFRIVEIVGRAVDRRVADDLPRKMARAAGLSLGHDRRLSASRSGCAAWASKSPPG